MLSWILSKKIHHTINIVGNNFPFQNIQKVQVKHLHILQIFFFLWSLEWPTHNYILCVRVGDHKNSGFSLVATCGATYMILTSLIYKRWCTWVSHSQQTIQDGCLHSLALFLSFLYFHLLSSSIITYLFITSSLHSRSMCIKLFRFKTLYQTQYWMHKRGYQIKVKIILYTLKTILRKHCIGILKKEKVRSYLLTLFLSFKNSTHFT
jgi:hypothetical protein